MAMKTAAKVIAIAEAEVGYLEKASNKNLDDKTANAGSANYTKYARDLDAIPGFYNFAKQGYAWCDMFVDWCFVQAFGAEEAVKLLGQPENSYGAGCLFSSRYYKKMGQLHMADPKPGDQIFFWNAAKDDVAHTGLVYKVDETYVYTIEGNTSGASGVIANGGGVCKKKYRLDYERIYSYGRPAYDEEAEAKEEVKEEVKKEISVKLPILRSGDRGDVVKAMQILLIGYKFSCGAYGADGIFGTATDYAVRRFQRENGLEIDGICGPATWAKLLGV